MTGGVLGVIAAAATYLFGPWDAMIMVLLAVTALDYVTGVACAAVAKELSSLINELGQSAETVHRDVEK